MKSASAILVLIPALWLTGCVVGRKHTARNLPPPPQPVAKPKTTPAPPPGPLSIPQTEVKLPPPQALDPEAVAAAQPPEEPAGQVAAPARTTPRRRATVGPPPITPAKPPEPEATTVAPPPENTSRIQEILPASEQKRLQDLADSRKREIRQWLEHAGARRLSRGDATRKKTVESYLKLSDQEEALGDMRQASDLAERAWILAKDLQSGR